MMWSPGRWGGILAFLLLLTLLVAHHFPTVTARRRQTDTPRRAVPEDDEDDDAGDEGQAGESDSLILFPERPTSTTPIPHGHQDIPSALTQDQPVLPFFNASVGYISLQNVDHPKPDDVQVGCKELRSKRYISDGFCTSIKPITEVVCTGHCLPVRNLPWYAEFIKVWARTKVLEWRCVDDVVRRKNVELLCENGETRTYKIKVVKSCKCKRYMQQQNESSVRRRKSRRKKGRHRRRDNVGNTRRRDERRRSDRREDRRRVRHEAARENTESNLSER